MSRRRLFSAAGVAAAVISAASAGTLAGRAAAASTASRWTGQTSAVPRPRHQGGIITPAQDRMHYCAFDITTDSKPDVVAMLRNGPRWNG